MGSRYEVEITITSAKDLKNVNWRHGPVKPYAVVWVDPKAKCSTRVDEEGDTNPLWNETLLIPFDSPIEDSTLHVDVVHANAAEDTKPLIGSARLRLRDVVDEAGLGRPVDRKLELKRPSGRPHGKLEVRVNVREPRYRAPDPYYAPPYGVPPPGSRDYPAPPQPYGSPYGGYGESAYAAPPTGYPYGAPPPPQPYGQPSYGQPAYGSYGQPAVYEEKKKNKFGGMGTGLAVGAVAGVLGGLALAEGAEYVEDKIADDAAEKVEDDLGYDDAGDDW
ncbi:OLC1v1027466C1 [Oldenlandia corymbosa var. corymbosa]|uniref:OLC1v1027466C1 n=1 Tax=Oldenlandia corymbosa var. corymbosa TaxID=529605 RepID=A0AAV1CA19_OLDCO|nr:OLC1v1027466C1 [Oldenlandia corymbosa var. corymbosa]